MSSLEHAPPQQVGADWVARYASVRQYSDAISAPLSPEDCAIQSMPDASPTRWHLAHTTWFFETFLLARDSNYVAFDPQFHYLFNSYYNSLGRQYPRAQRGMISRPGLREVRDYRAHVDRHMLDLLEANQLDAESIAALQIGLNHEQQHQELMLTDIKHVLSCNPLYPAYQPGTITDQGECVPQWIPFGGRVFEIGFAGPGFAFDNEFPRHHVYLEPFEICDRLVTCGQYLQFVEDGGYQRPEFWLSLGWQTVVAQQWTAPLYWSLREGRWHEFTLAGLVPLRTGIPVVHLSYFEADAYARWAAARLPTEAEWEIASQDTLIEAAFADELMTRRLPVHPGQAEPAASGSMGQMFGEVWQWTSSSYGPYPGYAPPAGALGEYNGKFMCNQYVLRGGSCATPGRHIRRTYRNFFPAEARWQFSGLRLARSS